MHVDFKTLPWVTVKRLGDLLMLMVLQRKSFFFIEIVCLKGFNEIFNLRMRKSADICTQRNNRSIIIIYK